MHTKLLRLLTAAALALVLAGCGHDKDNDAALHEEAVPGEFDEPAAAEPKQLDDSDLAATVSGTEIPAERIEQRLDQLAASPQLGPQLEQQGAKEQARAQLLTQEIVTLVLVKGAEEEGIEITEADLADTRQDLVAEVGGEEAFEEFLAESGQTMADVDAQLQLHTAVRLLTEHLAPEAADAEDPQAQMQGQMVIQQWIGQRLANQQIAVNPEFGTWDQRGQVLPPGMDPGQLQQPVPEDFDEDDFEEFEDGDAGQ